MHDVLTVRDWLKALGTLCAGSMSTRDAQAKLATYVPMLAHEFPKEAFTPTSLAAVARACTFFPAFGELARALSAWWEDNRPYVPASRIAGPARGIDRVDIPKPRDPPTDSEILLVGEMVRSFRADRAKYAVSQAIAEATAKPKSRPLADPVLVASYEKLAAAGDKAAQIRLEMLRRNTVEPQEATP